MEKLEDFLRRAGLEGAPCESRRATRGLEVLRAEDGESGTREAEPAGPLRVPGRDARGLAFCELLAVRAMGEGERWREACGGLMLRRCKEVDIEDAASSLFAATSCGMVTCGGAG